MAAVFLTRQPKILVEGKFQNTTRIVLPNPRQFRVILSSNPTLIKSK
jgi:hypothetical protein